MEVRAVIIGLGRIASLLEDDPLREKPATHAGALAARADCTIVGGVDTDPERRAQFGARWNVTEVSADAPTLLRRLQPNLVVVATHPDSHYRYVAAAAAAGVPVVVCEKPLAHTMYDARRIVRLAKRSGTRVVVNHERRYSADYRLARRAVVERRFGRLVSVTGTLYFGSRHSQAAVFQHDGTHLVDALNFVSAERLAARGRFGSLRRRRSSSFIFGELRPSRVPVVIEVGSERDHLEFSLRLSFERGAITVGNGRYRVEVSRDAVAYSGYRSLFDLEHHAPQPTGYFAAMMADAVACVYDPLHVPASGAADAAAVMKVIRSVVVRW